MRVADLLVILVGPDIGQGMYICERVQIRAVTSLGKLEGCDKLVNT